MNKIANVVFAYIPKNDDELELKVGDKIEVIGIEEAGWWKGKLKGRVGVFPANFVQVIETGSSPTTQSNLLPTLNNNNNNTTSSTNKLTNLFGSTIGNKNSLSNNSLNINNNNNNNINSNNNNNINLTMNSTHQQQDNSALATGEDPILSSEKRPKPIRGIGYGDIFAAGGGAKTKPLPADPITNSSSERLTTGNSIGTQNTLQKQIPKKPPPPAPVSLDSDQAPALPPKPANHFSPHLQQQQHSRPPIQQQQHHHQQQQQQHQASQQVREQARVIYAYEPLNEDELAMEVGDIIDVIDKDIEDAGWWKGELRGKIGVFPDNFVQLVDIPDVASIENQTSRALTTSQPVTPNYNHNSIEGKIKPVFAATPKDFSKELENNLLEKQQHNINNSASLLSVKRNKLQQMSAHAATFDSSLMSSENGKDNVNSSDLQIGKLNHITANRAKGPTRKPPSNVLNKRNQSTDQVNKESNGKDDLGLGSLPLSASSSPHATTHDLLSSLPTGQHTTNLASPFIAKSTDAIQTAPIKPSLSLENVIDNQTPKTSQRLTQTTTVDKNKSNTPPWMVELKKAHAEKKRDTPLFSSGANQDDEALVSKTPEVISSNNTIATPITTDSTITDRKTSIQSIRASLGYQPLPATVETSTVAPALVTPPVTTAPISTATSTSTSNLSSEISELKNEVRRLRDDLNDLSEIKSVIEVMKIELKACQTATENQKRYIKDLVNNLADERKKIASMQEEIDRNLK